MAKLTTLGPSIGTLSSTIAHLPQGERERNRQRDQDQPWRKLYKTSRWQQLAARVKLRDCYTCQRCGRVAPPVDRQLAADHIKPHRGDLALFWDESNVQTLCAPCHNGPKQREEARTR